MPGALTRRASELAAAGAAFVTATVVRAQAPTSVEPGNVALVLADGTIEGFVGGVCAEHSVRLHALAALASGDAVLLRILPDGPEDAEAAGVEVGREEGAVTVSNPCLSGGAIEVFLEPVLPAPRVLVLGETPVCAALRHLGPELGLTTIAMQDGSPAPARGDLALVVGSHGRDEPDALRRGLEAELPYVGLVASRRRGAALVDELRSDGVAEPLLAALDTPAGLDIGARTPAEIALSILARIVAVRRSGDSPALAVPVPAPVVVVDPVCGMSVVVAPGTPLLEHERRTVYFCGDGCRATFAAQHVHATAAP